MKITRVEALAISLPAARGRISLTEPAPAPAAAVLVRVHTDTPHVGIGFTTAPVAGKVVVSLIEDEFGPLVAGEDPATTDWLFTKAQGRFRTTGWGGLAARAYAGIDIALWDLKGKAAGLPLFRLLGGQRTSAACFVGDAAAVGSEVRDTIKAAQPLIDQGVHGVAVDVGSGNVQLDADRVQQIRDALGEAAWLGIAVDGRYDLGTALAMAHFFEEDVGVDWIDTPLPVEDRVGYQRLAERMEVPIAAGSSFDDRDDFRRALEAGFVRVLRPDPLRLGGITPLLKVAALAEAFHVSVVPYRTPELGVHLACALPNSPMAEWGSWLAPVFAAPVVPQNGRLIPPARPGHGMELGDSIVAQFSAR
jgi:L-alanine-DL-glutamate epimerase-like enolase superfamily enzyme